MYFYKVPIYAGSMSSAVNAIIHELNTDPGNAKYTKCISATSAHGLVEAHKDSAFKINLMHFYWNLPDGMPLVFWGRIRGCNLMERCYGPDLFEKIMKATAFMSVSHFFCGGKPGVADSLKLVVENRFYNKNVTGTYCPPFSPMLENDWIVLKEKVSQSKAQVVWVGLSTPKQEKFALELSKLVEVKFIITIGAAFDFHTGNLEKTPTCMQAVGLEWFFRLYKEPFRLWKRYFEVVPKFTFLVIADLLKYLIQQTFFLFKYSK